MSPHTITSYRVRKWYSAVEEIHEAGGRPLDEPLMKAAVGVVFANPFAGKPFQQDLSSLTEPSHELGRELGARAVALLGGRAVEGYGKGGMVGVAGEQEHVVACVTTVFGNAFRDAVGGGKAWISSVTKMAAPASSIDIPLAFKDEVYVRSHYDAITLNVPDGPLAHEILVCVAVSSGPRPHERAGGMTKTEVEARG